MKYPLEKMLQRIEAAVKDYPKAAMFELYSQGYTSLFEQLISCVISIRTLDENTIPVSLKLFSRARTPQAILRLGREKLEDLLYGTTFPGQKADTMLAVAAAAVAQPQKALAEDYEFLTAIKGIGPKCANLALGIAANIPAISVDVHVHRVVNRWGMIQTSSPEKTMKALEETVPQKRWIDINRLLMPFGKHICTFRSPHCSTCPVEKWCLKVGVTKHR